MADRVSLKQVALAAKASISTASLALSGDQRLTTETRNRVLAAAKELGYVRDPILASLAGGRFKHTGKPIPIAACVGGEYSDALRKLTPSMGMSIRPIDGPLESLQALAQAENAVALILYQRGITTEFVRSLTIPTVLWADESPLELIVDIIETCEWWAGTGGALQRVLAAGYQRPAFVLTPASPHHWHDDLRLAFVRSTGLPYLEWNLSPTQLTAFLDQHDPDSVIGGIPMVHASMRELGRVLPFAALISFDNEWFNHVSGWVVDNEHRTQLTVELIEQRLRFGPRPPRRIIVPPHWQAGTTLGRAGA